MSQHPDTTTGLKLYGTLQQRKHVVWTTRLRTGHCHLNEYLHHFNIIVEVCKQGWQRAERKRAMLRAYERAENWITRLARDCARHYGP